MYGELLARNPEDADALHLLGMLFHDTGRFDSALGSIARAIELRPETPYYHSNLGNVLQQLKRFDDAELCYRQALRLDPQLAEAHNNLGNALSELDRVPEALRSFLDAIQRRPGYHEAYANLGNVLLKQKLYPEALACYREAARLAPEYEGYRGRVALALGKCAEAQARLHNHDGAVQGYLSALDLAQDEPDLHLGLAHSLLAMGRMEAGWREAEWRWRVCEYPNLSFPQPVWDGRPLDGRRILLWAEQGYGDTIQFVRFAEQVKRAGGKVVLECQPRLARLMRTCPWLDEVVPFGDALPSFDVHAPLQSLGRILRTGLAQIPASIPYLSADPELARQRVMTQSGGCRVGIAWSGNPENKYDVERSIGASQLADLKSVPGVEWFSLQKEDVPGDFADAAALVANLDLVISVDTAAAHLAGSLGKPVWTLLPYAADSRWLLDRGDTPWYPTMRLFRQPTAGDWDSVLARVRAELERFRDERDS
jgi:cytochrome c-type biogenesis protein CcmH/NrfG